MTPAEKILEIENQLENKQWILIDHYWLLNRVKRLTEALEFYADGNYREINGYGNTEGYIARKALANESSELESSE